MAHEFKYSQGKVRYDLVDPEAIHGIALALTAGQEKGYEEYSFRKVPVTEWIAAYQRHMREHFKYLRTGKLEHAVDKETQLLHIDCATCTLTFLRWFATQDSKVQRHLDNLDKLREASIENNHV